MGEDTELGKIPNIDDRLTGAANHHGMFVTYLLLRYNNSKKRSSKRLSVHEK